jgi:predicted nucleic acid-binding Zn ribbon protein
VTHHRTSLRSLGPSLLSLRDELAPATLLADVQRLWLGAVGSAIAVEAAPLTERAGVITVSCSAAVWAQELDLMGPAIVDRLNEKLGRARVKRLRCITV